MDTAEFRQKTEAELHELLAERKAELERLIFAAHEQQLKKVHRPKEVRTDIARILTVLREKQTRTV